MNGFDPSGIDLVKALLKGEAVDRVPFFPSGFGFCARNVGYSPAVMVSDPEKGFEAQLWTFEQYGFDWGPMYGYATFGDWELGGEMKRPGVDPEGAPIHGPCPVQSEEDVARLSLPDVKEAGGVPLAMEFSRLQAERGTPITINLGGSFTLAGNICPIELLCLWMLRKPGLVHRILRLATDYLGQIVRYWADTFGAGNIFPQIAEELAIPPILSPGLFKEFVFPYAKELNAKILAMGVRHIFYHICGDQRSHLPLWAEIPMGSPGICSIGSEVNLDLAIRYMGEHCIIAGNIDPRVIRTGPPEAIDNLCRTAMERGTKAPRGYMLMSGCEIPADTPPYHVYVMGKAIDSFRRQQG